MTDVKILTYETVKFCPICGQEFSIVETPIDDVQVCNNHPQTLYPHVNRDGHLLFVAVEKGMRDELSIGTGVKHDRRDDE